MKAVLTPLDYLSRSALAYPNRVAVVDGDRRFTYGQFAERAHRLASALRFLGVEPGDRVAVLAPNSVLALEAHFGPMLLGAVLVMLNTRLAAPELRSILRHSGAKVLLADPALECLVADAGVEHVVTDYEAFLE